MRNEGLRPIERTLYPPIRDLLLDLGFKAIQEIRISEEKKYIDVLLNYEGESFILEIKIGDQYFDLVRGLVQIYKYAERNGIGNMIVILFPEYDSNSISRRCETICKYY